MRDLALVAGMLVYLPIALRYPAAGVICWAWFSIMSPHRQVYGFAFGQPLNSVIAVATLVGWLVAPGNKRWTRDAVPLLLVAFIAWTTIETPFGVAPSYSWVYWDRIIRIFALVFLVFFLMTTKSRIHALVWTIVISLGFYGVKGGVFTILHGGHNIVYGPPDTVYSDNNQLALAVVTEIPLLYYLWVHTEKWWLRAGMLVAIVLQILMVFGSYSRGGVLALTAMLGMLWLRSEHKILYGLLGLAAVAGGLQMMPDAFFDRLHTVNSLNTDDSFQGRVNAWIVAYRFAVDHFPIGAGFYAPQIKSVFNYYLPGEAAHAAHSIYFQILGEHGFLGLSLYLGILVLGLRNALIVRRQSRGQPGLRWAYDLADMSMIALVAFYIGGAALSMAYADEYLLIIALMSQLRQLTKPETVAQQHQAVHRRRRRARADLEPEQDDPAEIPGQAAARGSNSSA